MGFYDEDIDRVRGATHPEYQRLRDAAQNPRALEDGSFGEHSRAGRAYGETEAQELGLRAIDQYHAKGGLRPDAADRLDDLVRNNDKLGLEARYLDAIGDPADNRAFGKLLADPTTGHLRFSPQETEAVRLVNEAMSMRGMTIGTGSAGGFALPFALDPSVMLTSNGALNPIRSVSRVFTVAADVWKGVSSAGVTASYDLFEALLATLPPREDRDINAPLFPELTDARLRTAITKACVATGTPRFSPHGLRRRRGSLYYKRTGSLAEVATLLGDSKRVAADHYVYALTDYREVDRSIALARAGAGSAA